ncbi:MAG: pyrroline-5-carboxylate reductase [Proteobacteria bacterium]|nr:pyrroline-5-carboxylate reductase [Pseudomonadota bacterium]
MLTNKTIGFIGSGNMAEALIRGLIASKKVSAGQIIASDNNKERLVHIAETYEVKVFNKNYEIAEGADIIILALKPGDMKEAIEGVADGFSSEKVLVSIAAGITTDKIHMWLRSGGLTEEVPVVRAMPNTPAIVGEGATGIAAGRNAGRDELKLCEEIFAQVGKVVTLDDESLLNGLTGLSGSGPAYVFLFMEALCDGGVKCGLDYEDAKLLALQTTLGAALLALDSDKDLKALRKMVSSPGGTTIEGLKKLDESGFYDILIGAVRAASKRAEELSSGA